MSKIHEHWTSRLGFIMATAGSAVGLGSLWRFPYIAGVNGGGAFILLYLLFTILIGYPVFVGEIIIGRKSQKSAVCAYSDLSSGSDNWRILGWLNVFTSTIILSFYCVIAGWSLSYTLMSLNQFALGKNAGEISQVFDLLFASPGINIFWFALYLLINVGIVVSGVRKGIEHWSKILMPALFIILISLFIYATTMPGFGQALRFIFVPDFSKLSASGILSALGMALFTLSVGLGILITYGSYMQKEDDIAKNGLIITLMTVFVSLIAAMTIFPIVFSFGLPPQEGPGLVFKTLPVLFAKLPASLLISTVFFSLLLFAAITSSISLLEVLVANVIEIFNITRKKAAFLSALLVFIIGIPSALTGSNLLFPNWEMIYGKNFFDTMDYLASNWLMPIAALCTTLFIGWSWKKKNSVEELLLGAKSKWFAAPWFFAIRWIAPIAIIVIILREAGIV